MIWHQRKYLLSLFLTLIRPLFEFLNLLGNLMFLLPDNGLKREVLKYSSSIDSITHPNPSLIQLSILYKISWIDLLELINVLLVELK